jgi:hypothetical protein
VGAFYIDGERPAASAGVEMKACISAARVVACRNDAYA